MPRKPIPQCSYCKDLREELYMLAWCYGFNRHNRCRTCRAPRYKPGKHTPECPIGTALREGSRAPQPIASARRKSTISR